MSGKTFDLNDLDTMTPAEAGTVVELEHPITGEPLLDGEGNPWTITVRGEDSATVKAVIRKQQDRRSEKLRKGRGHVSDSESFDVERVEVLVAATIGWSGLTLDGALLEFNAKNARRVYGDDRFAWLVEQVEAAARDRKRFFSKPSSS